MGLRFRKSVKICKGVKLNFSKSGTSVTFGEKGYHKTISSTGRVTTTVGLPGTGIYWTDSKKIGGTKKKANSKSINNKSNNNSSRTRETYSSYVDEQRYSTPIYDNTQYEEPILTEIEESVSVQSREEKQVHLEDFFSGVRLPETKSSQHENTKTLVSECEQEVDYNQIRSIYVRCDETIEWDEIQAGVSFTELMMDKSLWSKCRRYAPQIVNGNVDTYLEVIEEFKPVDDLLLYCGDFEFGTDKGNYMEVEFDIIPDSVLHNKEGNPLFNEYVYAVSIRVARDIMALLPVATVVLHVEYENRTILSIMFKKNLMVSLDYKKMTASEIASKFEKNDGMKNTQIDAVKRMVI